MSLSSQNETLDRLGIQGQRADEEAKEEAKEGAKGNSPRRVTDYSVSFNITTKNKEAVLKCIELANSASILQRVGNGVTFIVLAVGKSWKDGRTLGLVDASLRYCTIDASK